MTWSVTKTDKFHTWECSDKYAKLTSVTLDIKNKVCKAEFTTRLTNDLKKVYDHNKGESKKGCCKAFVTALLLHHFIDENVSKSIIKEISATEGE